jgi:hypothetical protein
MNDDVWQHTLTFVDPNELILLQETCKYFYNLIDKSTVKFPSKALLFSDSNLLKWAIEEHMYHVNKIHMFREAIWYSRDINVFDYLYQTFNGDYYLTRRVFNIALHHEDLESLEWLLEKKCEYDRQLVLDYLPYASTVIKQWIHKHF